MSEPNTIVCLEALRGMIESWSNNRLMVYNIKEYVFALTGQKTYTLGPTGDWDIERPMAIEQAYARLNNGTQQELDIPMQGLTNAQYAAISVKNTQAQFGFAYYNDGDYPISNFTLFPIPTGPASIVLWLRQPLLNFDDLDAQVTYPPGYERAFRFNLAIEIAAEFGKVVQPDVVRIAKESKDELERLNSVPRFLQGDGGTQRYGKGKYFNWITGNFWTFNGR